MKPVPVLVMRAAGINCDEETMHCWRQAGATPTLVHVNQLIAKPLMLDDFAIVTIPGGFSYGDDVAAGVILAQKIQLGLAESLKKFVDRGGGVLGICNGFQVLVKMGLLPGGEFKRNQVTLTYNDSAHFEARWVRLEVCTDKCPFVSAKSTSITNRQLQIETFPSPIDNSIPPDKSSSIDNRQSPIDNSLALPVEHAEGKIVTASESVTRRLFESGQVVMRYVDDAGRFDRYPANPNGSVAGIAGLCDPTGRIFGLMPHPDRHYDHTQHPLWTRRQPQGPADGLTIFLNAVKHWQNA